MTRNLIATKAWKNGREQICKKCTNWEGNPPKTSIYDWNNCHKQQSEKVDYFSMWDGKNCRYFVPKGESE